MPPRFLTLADVSEALNISAQQAYSLVRSGELPAIQVGGRLMWRIEAQELEGYIQRMYAQTRARNQVDPAPAADEQPAADPGHVADEQPASDPVHVVGEPDAGNSADD